MSDKIADPRPTRLYLIPVRDVCNAHCTFCYMIEKPADKVRPQFVDFDNLVRVVSEIKDNFSESEITGGGDPSIHPRIANIVRLMMDNGKYTKMYTNGFLLKQLPSFDEINISRVHWNSEINNRFYRSRFQNSLDEALDHYRPIAKKIRLQTVLLKGGIDSKDKILEFVDRYQDRVDVFMFRTLFSKCSLEKDKFVPYPDVVHPKVKFDTTLDDYDRPLFFMNTDCVVHDTFQY